MWERKILEQYEQKMKHSREGGGIERIEKQHLSGKMTARERLEFLFDKDTFVEINGLIESRIDDFGLNEKKVPGDGVVTGYGKINGRLVFASSQDFTVIGGTLGEYHSIKICNIMDMAYEAKAPYICINDSGGARIDEGISSLDGYSGIFYRNTKMSGVVPQIAVILGPCAGGACYSPAIMDFIFMSESNGLMFITGPQVVKSVIGEEISAKDLGDASIHMEKSGVAHFIYADDQKCLEGVQKLLSYLPNNCFSLANRVDTRYSGNCSMLEEIVPDIQKKAYDVKEVIKQIVDDESYLEIQSSFAKSISVGLARLDGNTIGIIANQPSWMGGALDVDSSDKAARFIRFCDCFNIPVVSLVDVTGFMPGSKQEHAGIIRHGAKMLYAFSEATVPKISLITRKAYGGAYIAMNSKSMGADIVLAWPIAQLAVMGAEGAVSIIFRQQIKNAADPEKEKKRLMDEYEDKFMNPYVAASRGYIDAIVRPEETRNSLVNALEMLHGKLKNNAVARKHGNIPL